MILYHGTTTKHLDAILRDGLLPRRTTKRRSNWKGVIKSKLDFVYLTDAYPVYYAMNPALSGRRQGESDILVLKVDVDESALYPDEDYIAWEMSRNDGVTVKGVIASINPASYQEHWKSSLERNGIVCTPAVSPDRIVSHKVIARSNLQLLMAIGGDAMPTPLNYLFMGEFYGKCLESLFEQGEKAAIQTALSYWRQGKAS